MAGLLTGSWALLINECKVAAKDHVLLPSRYVNAFGYADGSDLKESCKGGEETADHFESAAASFRR